MYTENVDSACTNSQTGGYDYYPHYLGRVPSPFDIAFFVQQIGSPTTYECEDGHPSTTAYPYEFKMGSIYNPPVEVGWLAQSSAQVEVLSEDQAAPLGTDYFGCDTSMNCTNPGYGIHVFSNGSWQYNFGVATTLSDGPPCLKVLSPTGSYWAFKSSDVNYAGVCN